MDKRTIVEGIDISRSFTGEEIIAMHARGKLRDITLQGYCTRADSDGTIRFIPWYDSTWFRMDEGKPVRAVAEGFEEAMLDDVESNHPIIRRTPQERVAAMMLRLLASSRSGTIPGVPPELIKRIVGGSWREGEPLTAEVVQAVAAHYLGLGEEDNKASKGNFAIKDRTPTVA